MEFDGDTPTHVKNKIIIIILPTNKPTHDQTRSKRGRHCLYNIPIYDFLHFRHLENQRAFL